MPRDFRVSLDDILEAVGWIETYDAGMDGVLAVFRFSTNRSS